ncbi:GntR family transcriptional regulator [Rhizobium sp. Leaf384]|nr:GntR family transcriptional regulator [Rhizobium sp. Leaf384]KQS76002.1 GntR family transcriptional regulator [Rhizobium sp. Leaf383]
MEPPVGAQGDTLLDAVVRHDDPRPLHQQVKEALLRAIEDGRLPHNGKLPSERKLVESFGVSRITVRHAIQDLIRQGMVKSQPGKGLYVTLSPRGYELQVLESFTATALSTNRQPGSVLVEVQVYRPAAEITRPLFLPEGAEVVILKRVRLIDGVPVAIQTDWLPAAQVPGLASLDWTGANRSLYAELRDRYHIQPGRGHTTLSARMATPWEAERLDLDHPAAVLTVDQIVFDRRNRPINMTALVHHPERYPLTLTQS